MPFNGVNADYREALRRELKRRQEKNARYSLRAFALFLGVSRTALSDTLSNKRHLSRRNVLRVAEKLSLPAEAVAKMLDEVCRKKGGPSQLEA